MKRLACSAAISALAALAAIVPLSAQAGDFGVSVGFNQPGVYGRVDIGGYPQPLRVSQQPVFVAAPRAVVVPVVEPWYLSVPPHHQRHWHRYCGLYNACGRPVYFVQERWVQQPAAPVLVREVPRYRHEHERRDFRGGYGERGPWDGRYLPRGG